MLAHTMGMQQRRARGQCGRHPAPHAHFFSAGLLQTKHRFLTSIDAPRNCRKHRKLCAQQPRQCTAQAGQPRSTPGTPKRPARAPVSLPPSLIFCGSAALWLSKLCLPGSLSPCLSFSGVVADSVSGWVCDSTEGWPDSHATAPNAASLHLKDVERAGTALRVVRQGRALTGK